MIKAVLKRIDELIENAEYHYYAPGEEKWMEGYLEALKIVKQEIEKKFLPKSKTEVK